MHETHSHTLINFAVGFASSVCAVLTTFQEQLEWGIRVSGGILGLLIGVITLVNLIRNKKSK